MIDDAMTSMTRKRTADAQRLTLTLVGMCLFLGRLHSLPLICFTSLVFWLCLSVFWLEILGPWLKAPSIFHRARQFGRHGLNESLARPSVPTNTGATIAPENSLRAPVQYSPILHCTCGYNVHARIRPSPALRYFLKGFKKNKRLIFCILFI